MAAGLIGKAALKVMGADSSSAPGLIASRLQPSLLGKELRRLSGSVTYVTGTNGKSTTNGMLASILRESGSTDLVHNQTGANLAQGVLTSLLRQPRRDVPAALEVDEAVLAAISEHRSPDVVVVTNFFRDQLDRFGELWTTVDMVRKGLRGTLVTNADDPFAASLSHPTRLTYGLDGHNLPLDETPTGEVGQCPNCHEDVIYEHRWLGQLGDYRCPSCDFRRPEPNVVLIPASEVATLRFPDGCKVEFRPPLPGTFNLYNALAAAAASWLLGVAPTAIRKGLERYRTLFGRGQAVSGMRVFLIKNPLGASEVLRLVGEDSRARVMIAVNDNYADGRDVSWLWDAHFEHLRGLDGRLVVSGERAADMGLRLLHAGIEGMTYCPELARAVAYMRASCRDGDNLYILPTYTALLKLRKLLNL